MSEANRVYLVARVGWRVRTWRQETHFYRDSIDTPAEEDRRFVPVAAFTKRESAAAHAWALELEAARLFNPFVLLGSLDYLTSLVEIVFCRKFEELVGPLPNSPLNAGGRTRQWRLWWDEHAPSWPDETLEKVWELLDAVRFYAILEVDAD